MFANVELYLQAWYYPLRSLYSRVCPDTLRLCRNCLPYLLVTSGCGYDRKYRAVPQPAERGGFPTEEEEEGGHPPGLALSPKGAVSSARTPTQEQARGSQAEDQIRIGVFVKSPFR